MSAAVRPSFVIVDPSLRSFNGHFLHYDNVVAEEARAHGFNPVALASRLVQRSLPAEFELRPCFRYELEGSVSVRIPWFPLTKFLRLLRNSRMLRLLARVLSRFFDSAFFRRLGQIRLVRSVENKLGQLSGTIGHWLRQHWPDYQAGDTFIARAFLSDLRSSRSGLDLRPGTVFFMHTTTHRQIVPAVKFLEEINRPNIKLIIHLRYSVAPNPYYPQSPEAQGYRKAFAYVEKSRVRRDVHFVTDSELLRAEYAAITSRPIGIVPIPHTPPQTKSKKNGGASNRPIHLVYLGNARSTKGFHYLAYLVSQLRPQLEAGVVTAEFQANVMFQHDLESIAAVAALRRDPVSLIERELSVPEYAELLERADLILLPYQLLYYHSQTSGIFAEALGAAKPVVVPRGTWMAEQIKGKGVGVSFLPGDRVSFAEAVQEAIDRYPELRAAALAYQRQWLSVHNPVSFFSALIAATA